MRLLVYLFVLVLCNQISNGYRILGIFPLNIKSHWGTAEQVLKGLAKHGHQVDVVTHFPQRIPIPNYTDINIEGSLPKIMNNVSATEIVPLNLVLKSLTDRCGTKICHLLEHPKLQDLIKNPPQNPPYDVVIVQLFVAPCFLAFARHLKIPMAGVVGGTFNDWFNEVSGNPANPSFVPSFFSTYSQYMNFNERLMNFLTTNWVSYKIHQRTNKQVEFVQQHFGIDITSIKDLYYDMSLYLVNSHHSINGIRPITTSVVEIGGAHIIDDDDSLALEVKKWLDESKDGCIYFTFGSLIRIETFPKELLEQFYESFKKIAPVRVLMKAVKKEELPPGLPKNVMTQSWFQQTAVLKHKNIRGFITHGGLMGTQESIYFGIPMIGIPLFGDQYMNIQNYVNKKIAISLKSINNVTEKKLTSALNSILKDPSYLENAQRLSKLFVDRPMKAVDTAIYWIEYIVRNGKILQSPVTQLYWWQRNLFDIYAFIFILISTVLCIIIFTFRKLKNLLCKLHNWKKINSKTTKFKKNK